MMTFYTGMDAREYKKYVDKIVKYLIKNKIINAKNPKKAQSEAIRYIIKKFYFSILNDKIETIVNNTKEAE